MKKIQQTGAVSPPVDPLLVVNSPKISKILNYADVRN